MATAEVEGALRMAAELDRTDPLARFRLRFSDPEPGLAYLDGNSLGRMPLRAFEDLQKATQHEWSTRLIRGWNEGWITLPERLGAKIAKLIGAKESEVVCCDSTSVNLFKVAMAALQAKPNRKRIVTDSANFPSDVYVLQGCAKLLSRELTVVQLRDPADPDPAEIEAHLNADTALLALSHTMFKSGALHDMERLTESAHRVGAFALWDLSHSTGAVPVELGACDADLAVSCTYKYLNGGPGSPAYLYVREDLQDSLMNPIWGWFGQKDAFAFGLDYSPDDGIRRFHTGSPHVISMIAAEAGVDLLLEAGMDNLRRKSIRQSEFLISIWEEQLKPLGVWLASPRDPQRRGSHVTLGHPDAWRINQALVSDLGVIPDFRPPDNIRFGIAPIYTTFAEIAEGMLRTKRVIEERLFEKYSDERATVT